MIKQCFGVCIVLCTVMNVLAQTASDALRVSQSQVISTARGMATGGAMGALGADFSILAINPAATGAFRSSEFIISGGVFQASTESMLLGSSTPSNTVNETVFGFSNIGVVFASQPNGKFKTSNFAVGYNKIADFHAPFSFSGRTVGSITDRFIQLADGFFPDELSPFEEGLGYATGAIYDFEGDLFYESDYQLNPDAELMRRQIVNREGSNGEILLSYGGNFNEKLLFGITLGIPIYSFDESRFYEEEDAVEDNVPFFNALRFQENVSTSGNGFNLRVGATYKITQFVNVGAAYLTGTRYSLSDNFESQFLYDFTDEYGRQVFEEFSPEGSFEYNITTPWAVVGNAGVVIKRTAFVVAEIQYKDYSKAKYDFSRGDNGNQFDFQETLVNEDIARSYSSTINLKFGAEYALDKLRFRAGLILDQSPFADDSSLNPTYSGGLGFKARRVFLDFGYQHQQSTLGYLPYVVGFGEQPQVNNTTTSNRFILTFGYKWL